MASSSLPAVIIFDILTRTSLKTLDICKAVNKEWHDLIYESSFMPQFCTRTRGILCRLDATKFVSMDGCELVSLKYESSFMPQLCTRPQGFN